MSGYVIAAYGVTFASIALYAVAIKVRTKQAVSSLETTSEKTKLPSK